MSKPIVEFIRDVYGTPVLILYHLSQQQMARIGEIMLVNGRDPIHEARSGARVHMNRYDTHHGIVSLQLHGEGTEHYKKFLATLSNELGLIFPNMTICDYLRTA